MKSKNNRRLYLAAACALAAVGVSAQDGTVSPPLFQVGAVDVRPNFAYGITYDDNIRAAASGAEVEDFIHNITPGVTLGAGDYRGQAGSFFSANYSANLLFFQDNDGANATDHSASASFGGGERLSWRFDQTLVSASDADVQNLAAGGRVKRRAWTSTLGAIYDVSEKSNLETSFAYILNDFSSATTFDSQRLQGKVLLDWAATAKLHYGLGGSLGYDQVDGGNNAVFEQINTRAVWSISPKLALRAGAGVEFRQYQGVDLDRANFVFNVASDWKLSPLTVLSLGADRGTTPSNSLLNQFQDRTSLNATLAHKIGDRYTATLGGGYALTDSNAAGGTAALPQEDDYYFLRPALAVRLADRLAGAAYYQYRKNDSNNNASDFTNHQLGVSLSYAF